MTDEPLDAPFWEAARESRLVVQRCGRCGTAWWPAVERCGDCDGGVPEWVEVAPRGRVWSYAIYHRLFDRRLDVAVPYAIVAVELDDAGVCLPGRFEGPFDNLAVGSAVEARFVEIDTSVVAPVWSRPESDR